MPNIKTMMGSKYLKKEDVGRGLLVTIAGMDEQELRDDSGTEKKWCMHFHETDKPMVMNPTNLQLCAMACGSEETEYWIGKQIVLYTDPTVSMGGKLVGGIRIRAPKPSPAAAQPGTMPGATYTQGGPKPIGAFVQAPPPPPGRMADMDDDIPFLSCGLGHDPIYRGLRWSNE